MSATAIESRSSYWRSFALPGVAWLILFVVIPAYAVLAIAFGRVNFLFAPVPYWNPLHWDPGYISKAFGGSLPGGEYWPSIRNTLVYVAVSLGLCFTIGYPVAYYVARHAKRSKTLLIVLLVIPFWVSYLLRMLAWIGLLSPDGYVNQILQSIGIAHPPDWLNGNPYSVILALVYGYIPYFIKTRQPSARRSSPRPAPGATSCRAACATRGASRASSSPARGSTSRGHSCRW